MLTIRLRRVGKKKQAYFQLIISERRKDTKGDFLEALGFYNPHKDPPEIRLKEERIKYWLSKGAQVSDTVYNILVTKNILTGPKKKKGRKPKPQKSEKATTPTESTKSEEIKEEAKEKSPSA